MWVRWYWNCFAIWSFDCGTGCWCIQQTKDVDCEVEFYQAGYSCRLSMKPCWTICWHSFVMLIVQYFCKFFKIYPLFKYSELFRTLHCGPWRRWQ